MKHFLFFLLLFSTVTLNAQVWKNALKGAIMYSITKSSDIHDKIVSKTQRPYVNTIHPYKPTIRTEKNDSNKQNKIQQLSIPKLPTNTKKKKNTSIDQQEKVLNRFLSYIKIESQSIDEPDFNTFPITEGQKKIATFLANEIRSFKGKNVEITVSKDYRHH